MNHAFVLMKRFTQNKQTGYIVTVDAVMGYLVGLIYSFDTAIERLTRNCDFVNARNVRIVEIQFEHIRDYEVLRAYNKYGDQDETFLLAHPRYRNGEI